MRNANDILFYLGLRKKMFFNRNDLDSLDCNVNNFACEYITPSIS